MRYQHAPSDPVPKSTLLVPALSIHDLTGTVLDGLRVVNQQDWVRFKKAERELRRARRQGTHLDAAIRQFENAWRVLEPKPRD
jgi:hypothetical protein